MRNFIFTLLLGCVTLVTTDTSESPPVEEIEDENLWRIIGGEGVSEGDYPYQILLQNRGRFTCGGCFIIVHGTHFVLTAAHCVWDLDNPSRYTVIAGEVDRTNTSGNEQTRIVTKVIRHSRYSSRSLANDIALLAIDEPFTINDYVSPIQLPKQGQKTRGEVIVSGWGRTSILRRSASPILKQVHLTVLDDMPCRLLYAYPSIKWIYGSMLCAGRVYGGSGACNGDSGGPLTAVDGGYLAALVSWGTICAFPLQPGVYTEVSYFIDWIELQASGV
ncbi:unnamed protein product [Orchesella dallaii]|uniref:Peptidase S1 domain-containing protein n=1 Tax=Orchesella dallaii TaxID=48710 RepID=A0ABP1RV79_9HEXA